MAVYSFSTVYGPDFDYEAIANGSVVPSPVDSEDHLSILAHLNNTISLKLFRTSLGWNLNCNFRFSSIFFMTYQAANFHGIL